MEEEKSQRAAKPEACEITSLELRGNALNLEFIPSQLLSYMKTKQNLLLNSFIMERTYKVCISD